MNEANSRGGEEKGFAVNEQSFQIGGTGVLQDHFHIVAPTTVNIKTDSSTFRFAGQLKLPAEAASCSAESGIDPQSHISVKHETEDDVSRSLCFSPPVVELCPVCSTGILFKKYPWYR